MTRYVLGCVLLCALVSSTALGVPAFPGAEGAGGTAVGGRGCSVYHVTTLANSGPGSFRDAVSQSNRTIVFDVGGTVKLGPDPNTTDLYITANNITIAGQTAPGDGIFIYGQCLLFGSTSGQHCSNVVVRNLHVRPGQDPSNRALDCIDINGSSSIIDHCSCEWASDEVLSGWKRGRDNTVQYTIVAEPMNNAGHGYGSLVGSDTKSVVLSYHHNLYAHCVTRCPRLGNENKQINTTDWRNNVMYNWQSNCGYSSGGGGGNYAWGNFINNYYIAGNNTLTADRTEAFNAAGTFTHLYQSGNKIDPNLNGVFDGTDTGWAMFTGVYVAEPSALAHVPVYTQSADGALQTVLAYAGANWWNRDSVDVRIVNDVCTGGGTIKNWMSEVGGLTYYPEVHRSADFDTDQDGMPNAWELARTLDPNADDHNGDYDSDGYTNIEEYLNELGAWPAPKSIVWTGGTAGRFELTANWDLWQPSQYDQAEINSGQATVAYIGQLAGTLVAGNTAGNNGELAVTAGSLALANRLILGNAGSARGTATLTGGSLTAGGAIALASASSSTGVLKMAKGAYVQVGGLIISTGSGRSSQVGVEIAADGCSLIRTTAASTLGGAMDVQSLSGYRPREGDKFTVIVSANPNAVHFSGNFSSFTGNITLGLPGAAAFSGAAASANYQLTFLGYTNGDANGSHSVDGGDLALVGGSWNQSGKVWANAEFTGDGIVDGGDLALIGGNWNWSLPPPGPGAPGGQVPEPATAGLLAACGLGLMRRRCGRRG